MGGTACRPYNAHITIARPAWFYKCDHRMKIDVLTLFPAMFEPIMSASMMWKARDRGALDFRVHDIRDYALDKHRQVDDTPYGGGGGMILKPDVLVRAIESIRDRRPIRRSF